MSQRVIDDPAAAGWEFDADTGYWMWKGEEGTGDLWEQNGNNIHYSDGNVGIGTDVPDQKLHVLGGFETAGFYRNIDVDDVGTAGNWIQLGSKKAGVDTPAATFGGVLEPDGLSGSAEIQTRTGGALTPKVTIDSDGNVGIGTNDPKALVDAEGASVGYRFNDGTNLASFKVSQSDDKIMISQAGSGSGTAGLAFATGTGAFGTERMTIDSDGNVGIGTNDPDLDGTRGIHLYASGTTQMVRLQRGNGADFTMKAGSTLAAFQTSTNHPIVFRTNGQNDRMSIGADGRVDVTGTLYVNGKKTLLESGKIGYQELITTLVTLRKATMDETQDIRESLRDAIDELAAGFEQEIAAMPVEETE